MRAKRLSATIGLILFLLGDLVLLAPIANAAEGITRADFANHLADSPSACGSEDVEGTQMTPVNCLFLDEPIGGKPGYDLYTVTCTDGKCTTAIWNGNQVGSKVRGPIQAVLTQQEGKEYQGPFGLLYNYLSLIYNYMSGLIIGIAVLYVVYGGILIATSGGEATGVTNGKKRIFQAITGVILWFTASLILYTINPTFFSY